MKLAIAAAGFTLLADPTHGRSLRVSAKTRELQLEDGATLSMPALIEAQVPGLVQNAYYDTKSGKEAKPGYGGGADSKSAKTGPTPPSGPWGGSTPKPTPNPTAAATPEPDGRPITTAVKPPPGPPPGWKPWGDSKSGKEAKSGSKTWKPSDPGMGGGPPPGNGKPPGGGTMPPPGGDPWAKSGKEAKSGSKTWKPSDHDGWEEWGGWWADDGDDHDDHGWWDSKSGKQSKTCTAWSDDGHGWGHPTSKDDSLFGWGIFTKPWDSGWHGWNSWDTKPWEGSWHEHPEWGWHQHPEFPKGVPGPEIFDPPTHDYDHDGGHDHDGHDGMMASPMNGAHDNHGGVDHDGGHNGPSTHDNDSWWLLGDFPSWGTPFKPNPPWGHDMDHGHGGDHDKPMPGDWENWGGWWVNDGPDRPMWDAKSSKQSKSKGSKTWSGDMPDHRPDHKPDHRPDGDWESWGGWWVNGGDNHKPPPGPWNGGPFPGWNGGHGLGPWNPWNSKSGKSKGSKKGWGQGGWGQGGLLYHADVLVSLFIVLVEVGVPFAQHVLIPLLILFVQYGLPDIIDAVNRIYHWFFDNMGGGGHSGNTMSSPMSEGQLPADILLGITEALDASSPEIAVGIYSTVASICPSTSSLHACDDGPEDVMSAMMSAASSWEALSQGEAGMEGVGEEIMHVLEQALASAPSHIAAALYGAVGAVGQIDGPEDVQFGMDSAVGIIEGIQIPPELIPGEMIQSDMAGIVPAIQAAAASITSQESANAAMAMVMSALQGMDPTGQLTSQLQGMAGMAEGASPEVIQGMLFALAASLQDVESPEEAMVVIQGILGSMTLPEGVAAAAQTVSDVPIPTTEDLVAGDIDITPAIDALPHEAAVAIYSAAANMNGQDDVDAAIASTASTLQALDPTGELTSQFQGMANMEGASPEYVQGMMYAVAATLEGTSNPEEAAGAIQGILSGTTPANFPEGMIMTVIAPLLALLMNGQMSDDVDATGMVNSLMQMIMSNPSPEVEGVILAMGPVFNWMANGPMNAPPPQEVMMGVATAASALQQMPGGEAIMANLAQSGLLNSVSGVGSPEDASAVMGEIFQAVQMIIRGLPGFPQQADGPV